MARKTLAMELLGRGGPSLSWFPRRATLARAVRVDERAHPSEMGRVIPEEPDSDSSRDANGDAGLSEEDDDGGQEAHFPVNLNADGLGYREFTEEQIEIYSQDPVRGCADTLLLYVGDAVFSPAHFYADGSGAGYAVSGEFLEALDRHAATLAPSSPTSDPFSSEPQRFLFGRWNKNTDAEDWQLMTQSLTRSAPASIKPFNLLRERPDRRGVFEYLGRFEFAVDRAQDGQSLAWELLDACQPDERPELYTIPPGWTAEQAHAHWRKQALGGRQRLLFYLPRAPYFQFEQLGIEKAFLRKMLDIRRENFVDDEA
ncbi:unnamed protein product [Peniophora sp. CBMAI 1063]|nr:unnamed protein product [Peniophora sp. CBMAI 1063]